MAKKQLKKKVKIFLTAKNTDDRLTYKGTASFEPIPELQENVPAIILDKNKTFQQFIGIGGALTDAAAETFYKLSPEKQKKVINAYYNADDGIGYTVGRTNIHSCDFSSASYSYAKPGDTGLESFSIEHDLQFKIPLIKEALKLNPELKLFASPWSPPEWMKSNNDMLHGGKLKPEFYRTWAKYYIRFVEEYKKQNIPIWGLTVQNEAAAIQTWESCLYTAEEERDFIKKYLGPQLHKSGMAKVKLMIWDHNRGLMYQRAKAVYDDKAASKYVWGMGFHWYTGNHFENVRLVHDAWPDKQIFLTEACHYPFKWDMINDWKWGEIYGRSMIHDFNNWARGWTDWNIILDETGGPNHVGNYCFAPIHADFRDGTLHYINSYWYIGHFSKFIRPGAKRIICSSNSDELISTAFINPDGTIVTVVLNESGTALDAVLWLEGKIVKTHMPEHSIATFVVE